MPGITDTEVDAIESSLKKSLSLNKNKNRDLDQNIASSAQRLLQQTIEFVPAKKPYSFQFSSLKSKYILLKPSKKDEEKKDKHSAQASRTTLEQQSDMMNGPGPSGDAKMGESLPSPRVVIYSPEKVQLGWRQVHKVGGGLINMGNTCFLNATLQCLSYTPALVNYCLSDEHPKTCKQTGFCLMCAMRQHIKTALHHSGSAFRPNSILHKLKHIAKHFRHGRQEDAHEFLRLLMDGLQKSCLEGHKKLDRLSRETTVIHQIFGGFLRSQVQCLKCSARSNTYEPFMDLSLNLKDVGTVEGALAKFVRPETLDSANAYACERCGQKTPARKRFTLHKIPNVLTIQLNRFGYTRAAGKINKHIQFPDKLNIRQYMSHRQGEAEYYHLYAVLIHSGHHCNMGHYYCYVRAPSNVWYIMNDASVHPVAASRVFESQAYLLFYTRAVPSLSQASPKAPLIAPTPNGLVTPKFNGAFTKQLSGSWTTPSKTSGDVGVPVSRQMVSPTKVLQAPFFSGSSNKGKQVLSEASQVTPVQNHTSERKLSENSSSGSKVSGKERIVMQVKDGKVVTTRKTEDGHSQVKDSSLKKMPSFLADFRDSENSVRKEVPKVTENSRDRNKENSSSEKKLARSLSDSSSLVKALFKRKSDHNDADSHHMQKTQTKTDELGGADSTPKLKKEKSKVFDAAAFNHTPKLKKELSSGGGIPFPKLKKESSESVIKVSAENITPTLKKSSSSAVDRLSLNIPTLTRVNSSPAAHNVWHVHAIDSNPSPSLSSSSGRGEWTVKKQSLHTPQRTVTGSRKRALLDRIESVDSAKKQKLLVPSPQQITHEKSSQSSSGLDDSCKKTKANMDRNVPSVRSDHSQGHSRLSKSVLNSAVFSAQSNNIDSACSTIDKSKKDSTIDKSKKDTVCDDGESSRLNTSSVMDSSPGERRHRKHKKKHKLHKQSDQNLTENKPTCPESDQPSGKRKETDGKLNGDCDNNTKGNTDFGDSYSGRKKKRHINVNTRDEEDLSARKSLKLGESENEDAAKDVSKGSPQKEAQGGQHSSNRTVPVQAWDHYVKDSLGVKKKQGQEPSHRAPVVWDGSKTSEVVEQLCKRAAVTTWGGEKSEAEIEAEKEEKRRKKKTWRDHYEEEIDKGKVKKVKKKVEDIPWAFNPFQKFQNHRNHEKFRWDEDFGPIHKRRSFADATTPSLQRSHSDGGSLTQLKSSSNSGSLLLPQNHGAKNGHYPIMFRSPSFH